jgi:hypothetical protein
MKSQGEAPWRLAYWALSAAFVLTAVLNILQIHGGFLTDYLADLVVPALVYVLVRGLIQPGTPVLLQRVFGRTPELAAATIFSGSTITEVSQIYWPRGVFAGRFDLLDIAAYGVAIGAAYAADRYFLRSRQEPLIPSL